MNIKDEINKYAIEEDKPVLLWLFEKYHWSSEWHFVVTCHFEKRGNDSLPTSRVWTPKKEGRLLFKYRGEL